MFLISIIQIFNANLDFAKRMQNVAEKLNIKPHWCGVAALADNEKWVSA